MRAPPAADISSDDADAEADGGDDDGDDAAPAVVHQEDPLEDEDEVLQLELFSVSFGHFSGSHQ